ncbi:hypothetical protein AMAG_00342 [Allomyces macrogynus ATCC 38327]|uniref:Protein kinase domain-containing protein n=1 Tax=Allomyces macrogynus (strain ATCC 38327) TaxID=578462 RepID=A0A0L0RW91_ALLM3|nr:hypothetical protein AMAG_00342 [Allomyces macrogynus ATCC 38327]|eukprot:KNE54365.1 hypothetical protein AMAG_00342 [Allomyces macrogynus ATCC 38327]
MADLLGEGGGNIDPSPLDGVWVISGKMSGRDAPTTTAPAITSLVMFIVSISLLFCALPVAWCHYSNCWPCRRLRQRRNPDVDATTELSHQPNAHRGPAGSRRLVSGSTYAATIGKTDSLGLSADTHAALILDSRALLVEEELSSSTASAVVKNTTRSSVTSTTAATSSMSSSSPSSSLSSSSRSPASITINGAPKGPARKPTAPPLRTRIASSPAVPSSLQWSWSSRSRTEPVDGIELDVTLPQSFARPRDVVTLARQSTFVELQRLPNSSSTLSQVLVAQLLARAAKPVVKANGGPASNTTPVDGQSLTVGLDLPVGLVTTATLAMDPLWVGYLDFQVHYSQTMGEDAISSVHGGTFRAQAVQVRCFWRGFSRVPSASSTGQGALSLFNVIARPRPDPAQETAQMWSDEEVARLWQNEVQIMHELQGHGNILRLVGISQVAATPTDTVSFTLYECAKPLIELVFNLTIDWFDDDSLDIVSDVASALAFAQSRGYGHGSLTLLDIWTVPTLQPLGRPRAVVSAPSSGAALSSTAPNAHFVTKVAGFGLHPEQVAKRIATTVDTMRRHVYARYADPDLIKTATALANQDVQAAAGSDGGSDLSARATPVLSPAAPPAEAEPSTDAAERRSEGLTKAAHAAAVYALGALLYECVERRPVFDHIAADNVQAALGRPIRPIVDLQRSLANSAVRSADIGLKRKLRVKLLELMSRCWSAEVTRRPSIDGVVVELQGMQEMVKQTVMRG